MGRFNRVILILLIITLLGYVIPTISLAYSDEDVISYLDAGDYIGQTKTVEGQIVRTFKYTKGNVIFLNFHDPYKGYFTAIIWSSDWDNFPFVPEVYYKGKEVRATGEIIDYKGTPEIVVRDPSQIEVTIPTPTPSTGSIYVSSTSSGASIYLDGIYKGTTPKTLNDVPVGAHTIRLEKSRYNDWSTSVSVTSGSTRSVSAPLSAIPTPKPSTGSIYVSSTPSDASIYLDGIYKGTTPKTVSGVSVGSHTLKLTKSRYEDYTTTVSVTAGDTASIDAPLTVETGPISVSSTPSGADIYLDGRYKGTTPTTISDASPGSHTLKLEKYGYAEWLTSVHVTSGVTESITAPLTAADVSSPAIRIDKPAIIEQNNNELLEEGEKVTITYGANDPSGVTSIKILLDGTLLESQNQAGTYTVTTNSLTTGKHVIRVEATDSKSNSGFEELHLTVERTGPSVYFGTTRTAIKKGEDAIFTLSAVNPIGNPSMAVQLILKPPSGVSVTSSSFAKAGSGIYTCTHAIESGDNVRSIEVRLTGNEVGTHEIESEVYYQFRGSPKSPTRYDMLTLIVEPDTRSADSESEAREIVVPGFGVMVAIIGLLAAYLRRI